MRIAIVTNGNLDERFLTHIHRMDFVVGVDRAAYWLIIHGLVPHMAIGDFDSVSVKEFQKIKNIVHDIRKFPKEKDKTDTELAIDEAVHRNPQELTIYGGIGSRIDHTLANISLLKILEKKHITARIVDSNNDMQITKSVIRLGRDSMYPYLSLLPYGSPAIVSIKGCRYPLDHDIMRPNSSLGISNEIDDEEAIITVHKGSVLIIRSRD